MNFRNNRKTLRNLILAVILTTLMAGCFLQSNLANRAVHAAPVTPPQPPQTTKAPSNNGGLTGEYPFQVVQKEVSDGFYCGTYGSLQIPLLNISDTAKTIQKVYLEMSGDSGSFPFEIYQTRIESSVNRKVEPAESTTVAFPALMVRSDVKTGYYTLTFRVVYQDWSDDGRLYDQTVSYLVYFYGNDKPKETEKTDLRFLIETAPMDIVTGTYGNPMPVQISLINRGFDVADIISVAPVLSGDKNSWPFEITRTDYTVPVDQQLWPLAASQQPSAQNGTLVQCNFGQLTLRPDVTSGPAKLDFQVKFKYGSQAIQETTLSTYININGNPEEDAKKDGKEGGGQSVPRLICTGFETNPKEVKGGQPFTLNLRLKNTSATTHVQNIRVVLSSQAISVGQGESGDEPFITASGASSVHIPLIQAGEEYTLTVEMLSSVKVAQRAYPLDIKLEYEDAKASAINSAESISITVHQEVRIDTGKLELIPEQLTIGQEGNLSFPLYNKGKTLLYNVTVAVPEGQGISGADAYLGNVQPGGTSQVDMMIRGEEFIDGMEPRKLEIRYEDENGVVSKKEIEFTVTVMEDMDAGGGMFPGEFDPSQEMEPEQKKPFPIWGWVVIGVGVLALLIFVITLIKQQRRKKRAQLEDDAYFRDLMK